VDVGRRLGGREEVGVGGLLVIAKRRLCLLVETAHWGIVPHAGVESVSFLHPLGSFGMSPQVRFAYSKESC